MEQIKGIALAALDLDDTTLCSDSSLAPETAAAIRAAIKSGIEIVVASGRAYSSLPEAVLGIPGIKYAITSNGAAVGRVPGGERIIEYKLRPEAVRQVLDAFPDEIFEAFVAGQPYSECRYMAQPERYGCSEASARYVRATRKPVRDMRGFIAKHIDELDSIDIMCFDAEHKARLYAAARSLKGVYVTSSAVRLIEIADENAGKGAALRQLCAMLGVPAKSVAAFGNGDNDADMLRFAGFGVAVKNAWPDCLAAADYICESNDELGVAKTLMKLL